MLNDLSALEPLRPGIRVRLHFDRLPARLTWTSEEVVSDRGALGALFSACCRVGGRVGTALGNPLSVPMSVSEVAERLQSFSSATRAGFLDYVGAIESAEAPPDWVVPVYDLGSGGRFLLDGNHRAVATYLSGRPFELRLVVIHAPVDRRILSSLKFWDGGVRRFWRRREWQR